jgi:hypothetical protein
MPTGTLNMPYPTTGYLAGAKVRHILFVTGRKDADYQAAVAICGASPTTNKNKPRLYEWTDQWLGYGDSHAHDRLVGMKVCGVCASKAAKFLDRLDKVLTRHERPVVEYYEDEEDEEA